MIRAAAAAWRVVAVLLIAALQCCALDPLRARRAAATAAAAQDSSLTARPATAARWIRPSGRSPKGVRRIGGGRAAHYVNLLERGADSLLLRLHLIRSAQRTIDLQTFIFAEDDAGYLMLDELIKAARRGVEVRVIVDQLFSLEDPQLYAALARAHVNFELRVYNPTFHKASTPPLEFAAGILCCFLSFNQRMHNKLLLVDDASASPAGATTRTAIRLGRRVRLPRSRPAGGRAGGTADARFVPPFLAVRAIRAAEPAARRRRRYPERRHQRARLCRAPLPLS